MKRYKDKIRAEKQQIQLNKKMVKKMERKQKKPNRKGFEEWITQLDTNQKENWKRRKT